MFRIEKYSGVHIVPFYRTGNKDPAYPGFSVVYPDRMYRHPNMDQELLNAFEIRFTVFNYDVTEVVAYVEFYPQPGDGTEGWFSWDRWHYSSLWDLSATHRINDFGDQFRFIMAQGGRRQEYQDRLFYINQKWTGCRRDAGWFMSKSDCAGREQLRVEDNQQRPAEQICVTWENWWTYPQAAVNDNCEPMSKYQPPAFIYSPTSAPIRYTKNAATMAGMITIEVAPRPEL